MYDLRCDPSPRMRSRAGSARRRTHEVEADTVSLARADDVAEPERASPEAEHRRVRRDQRLAGELARPVGGDRQQRPPVLVDRCLTQVAVHAAAGRVEDPRGARHAHRLDDVLGQDRALVEVDRRLDRRSCDVRVRREVDHRVVTAHDSRERLEVADVCTLHGQAFVAAVLLEVPLLARGEVVVDRDPGGSAAAEQPIDEVATEKPGAADDEPALARSHPRDSHTGRALLQRRMGDEEVADDGREAFGVRCDVLGHERRDHHARIGRLLRVATVTSDDREDARADASRA